MKLYDLPWFPFAFILFGLIVHVIGIGGFSIYILDEAKNAAAAMEMQQQQEWILPTFNGLPRFDKPPLHYYFFMLGYKLFGVGPFGARFFPALLGWICFVFVYFFSAKSFGKKAGFFAGLALLSSIHWILQFHLAVPDAFLILFVFLTILYYEKFISSKLLSKNCLRASALFLGLATLSKGPVAIVLVGITILLFMMMDKKPLKIYLKAILDLKAWLLFLVVTLPWYVLIAWKTDGIWLREFIFHHNLHRFSKPMEGHGGGFYLTFLFVWLGFLPASLVLFSAFKKVWIKRTPPVIVSLASIFTAVTVLFFMLSGTKLPNYTAPVYPFLGIIAGWHLAEMDPRGLKFPSYISSLIIILIPVGLFLALDLLTIKEIDVITGWFIVPALIGLTALVITISTRWEYGWITASFGFVTFSIVLFTQALPAIDLKNPVRNSREVWNKTERVFHFQTFNPAFIFNLNKRVPDVAHHMHQLRKGDLILTNKKSLPEFQNLGVKTTQVYEGEDLFENTVTIILMVD